MEQMFIERLQEHYHYLKDELHLEVMFGGIFGSQNYGLSDENSDVDSLFVILPSFDDMMLGKYSNKQYSPEKFNGEHITTVPFIHFYQQLAKGSMHNFEILMSDYVIVNLKYEEVYTVYTEHLQDLINYSSKSISAARFGLANKHSKILEKLINKKGSDIFSDKKNLKKVSMNLTLLHQIKSNMSGQFSIEPNEEVKEQCRKIKFGHYSNDEVLELHQSISDELSELYEIYSNTTFEDYPNVAEQLYLTLSKKLYLHK